MNKTIISQMIQTIQGEGPSVGTPVLLIRTGNCNLDCVWCFVDGTQIRTEKESKNISEIQIGDIILGVNLPNTKDTMKTISSTKVIDIRSREAVVWKMKLNDGTELVGTPEHPILINNGYRPMFRNFGKIKPGNKVYKLPDCGYGIINDDYKKGWLAGYWDGDGSFYTQIRISGKKLQNKCRAASIDKEIIDRNFKYCHDLGINVRVVQHTSTKAFKAGGNHCDAVTSTSDPVTLALKTIVDTDINSHDWYRGYIAGIFDAEGSFDGGSLRISQITKTPTIDRIKNCLEKLNIKYTLLEKGFNIHSGKFAAQYFDKYLDCVCKRKFKKFLPLGINACDQIEVESVEFVGKEKVYNLTTDISTFIANDILVHNCDTKWSNNLKPKDVKKFSSKNKLAPFFIDETNLDDFINYLNKEFLNDYAINTVLLTGGEPLMNKEFIASLIYNSKSALKNITKIEIETNGVLLNDKTDKMLFYHWDKTIQINISPKLDPMYYRSKNIETIDNIIDLFNENNDVSFSKILSETPTTITWKFVYSKAGEESINKFIRGVANINDVYIMPLTPDYSKYVNSIDCELNFLEDYRRSCYDAIDYCLRTGYTFVPRAHVFVFNNFENRDEFVGLKINKILNRVKIK